ncbi:MAG: 23S rRNA (uridine(2552)-2'-O)-methyltransferase [Candidatus Methanoperedens sp.]|jgi:23S rRNA (uridine2552-2'-O)-methyltransferase|nr:23S rRNA (uridine(2552)-2'-O)-methyltransferase [Candidatus Methanoperedens sp.]PKL53197.1 MAG: 23S rRNA (uridine(2552)-2'-O)-methyltransferase [Candidatus Methanoperedenaceae archaeon HGW-Methanoperedenaceae-1]
MPRHRRDFFYRKAREEGYRSRAAYKLQQINERFEIIRKNDTVVDLGAAPGGWLQVAYELSGGRVVGVDLLKIKDIEGVDTIKGDIRLDETVGKIRELIGEDGADAVICDAAPNLSGNWSYDHARSIDLATSALECALKILKLGGVFAVKVFQGDMFPDFINKARGYFVKVQAFSPEASRSQSAEIYVIGRRLLSGTVNVSEMYSVTIEDIGENGDGIAKINNMVVFVKGTKKGQSVNIRIRDVKPKFAFGDIIG